MLAYLENNPGQPELEALLQQNLAEHNQELLNSTTSQQILQEIHERSVARNQRSAISKSANRFLRFAAAAAILAGLIWGGTYLFRNNREATQPAVVAQTEVLQPAAQGAVLTLSNGQQLRLDSLPNGAVQVAGNLRIYKKDGRITYEQQAGTDAGIFNTISTQKGNKYQLVLADGTIVWLNATSSITYPVSFTGKERLVNVSGEAYFEVTQNKEKPFKVMANGMEIQVLGTHFNVNAYANESQVKATLLEGSIEVKKGNNSALIKPGQQAAVAGSSTAIEVIKNADTELAMAWINGKFLFKDADIQTIMRQITRWYDVEVEYTGAIPDIAFSGDLSKNNDLQVLIEVLKESGLHLEMKGRKIIVMP